MSYTQNMTDNAEPTKYNDLTPEQVAEIKAKFEPLVSIVLPTEPGRYLDNQKHEWTLNADGTWTDRFGTTKPASENWVLAAVAAPFSLAK